MRLLPKPNPASRYPADPRAVFVLALCIFAAVPLVFGVTDSESLETFLPTWAVALWGVLLLGGAVGSLFGMMRQTPSGILVEQVSSVVVGVATVYYAAAAIFFTHEFTPGIAITLAWGLSCFWRWGQLEALVTHTLEQVWAVKRAKIESMKSHE